jgi:hypothetical protein
MVVNLLEVICAIGSTSVHLKSSESDPGILMYKELCEYVKDRVSRIDNLLDDIEIGLTVVPAALSIARLDDG